MEAILKGEGISVGYQQNTIIQDMDVQIPKGQITSIIGPNGCGKSTLLKALSRKMPVKRRSLWLTDVIPTKRASES